jgi:hypothetical protein
MPAYARKVEGKWRVVERDGTLVKRNGKAVDGGGYTTKEKAIAQAAAINFYLRRRGLL